MSDVTKALLPITRVRTCWLICTGLLAAFAFYFLVWNMVLPYPVHAREYADTLFVSMLLEGRNPYSLAENPTATYPYGPLYHFTVYPVAWVFGAKLQVLRAMSALYMVLECFVLYWGMRVSRVSRLVAAAGALLFFSNVAYNDFPGGPNSFGNLLLLLGIVLPLAGDFSPASIGASLVCADLGLCSKAYYVLCGPVLLLYLFLYRGKGAALLGGIIFAGLVAGSLAFLSHIFPLYLTNDFCLQASAGHKYFSLRHLVRVLLMYFPLGIGMIVLLLWRAREFFQDAPAWAWARWKFNWTDLRQPLILTPAPGWITFVLVVDTIVYLLVLGPNAGNLLTYVYELITPFLIWRCCMVLEVEAPRRLMPVACLLAAVVLVFGFLAMPMLFLHQVDRRAEWRQIADVIARYPVVLGAGSTDSILAAQGKPIVDGGFTEYYGLALQNNHLPIADAYRERGKAFFDDLDERVREQYYDALVLYRPTSALATPVSFELIESKYQLVATLPADNTMEHEKLQVWLPIRDGR